MRVIAFLLLLAVLPTAEVTEQIVHFVEQALHEGAAHGHHDDSQQDEHGCTGLLHLCRHQSQALATIDVVVQRAFEASDATRSAARPGLHDLTTPEPVQRPPIG